MKKKTAIIFLSAAALIFLWGLLKFVVGGNEDEWICDNGIWVAHGKPASGPPEEGCEFRLSVDVSGEWIAEEEKEEETEEGEEVKTVSILPTEILSSKELSEIIGDAVNWLKQAQEENGHFRYEYSVLSDTYSEDDNMVRQTGALYILGEVLIRDKGENYALKENIEKAISFFEENSEFGEMNEYKFRCVLRSSKICSLGGTGLALVGILDLVNVYPELGVKCDKLAADYLNFILAMKKPSEGFRDRYYLEDEQSEEESDFSNGEALLALARYYEYRPAEEVKRVIDESFDYFSEKYGQNPDFNFYLWGMAAVKKMNEIEPRSGYVDFVKNYTDWRIDGYKNRRDSILNYCAYFEGVVSAYSVLEPNIGNREKEYYLEEINYWLSRSCALQVDGSGFVDLVFGGNEARMKVLDTEKARGGFLTALNNPLQRIDYTQHCLSAYLQKLEDIDN